MNFEQTVESGSDIETKNQKKDRLQKDLVHELGEGDYDAGQMTSAYNHLMGLDDSESISSEIQEIVAIFYKFQDEGLPLNRIVEVIDGRQGYEYIPQEFEEYITKELKTDDGSRGMLLRLVKNPRNGTLSIYDNERDLLLSEAEIGGTGGGTSHTFIQRLLDNLKEVMRLNNNRELSIIFEE